MSQPKGKVPKVPSNDGKENLPMWTSDTMIRNRTDGRPLYVARVFDNCTFVVDLTSKDASTVAQIILPRDYRYWKREQDGEDDEEGNWHYKPVKI